MFKKYPYIIIILIITFYFSNLYSSDWPIYKGNIYFTGNNDEITVKNNNLKWLFQADDYVYNPIVSDGMVYFTDLKKNVYCLNEDNGKLIWKLNLPNVSKQFGLSAKALGKVKYPLIKDNMLFVSDSIVIYCINKKTGKVIWARTGMREEQTWEKFKRNSPTKTNRWSPQNQKNWDPKKTSRALVDSIYSNPVIVDDNIYYGTRLVFMSREIHNGHMEWKNIDIKSYSGFPSFYDEYIFTQSMDYEKNSFHLYCIVADTGNVKWTRRLSKPLKIFSPVVYKRKVYFASSKKIFCLDINTGEILWDRDYSDFITSNPSFTEREIVFTVANRLVVAIDPETGNINKRIDLGNKSSPYFVLIRDQIYIGNTFEKQVGKQSRSFSSLKAMNFEGKKIWEFRPPFPGGSGQPVASRGIMFLPAGNYLYAVGTDYYPRVVDGGSAYYNPYGKKQKGKPPIIKEQKQPTDKPEKIDLRDMKITVKNKKNSLVPSIVEIKKWDKGKLVYDKRVKVTTPDQVIKVPDMDDVEITATSVNHIPKKVIISRKDKKKDIELDEIEKGKGIVVENIHFEINQAYLEKSSLNILDKMIETMKRNKKIKLEVRGHTDSTGSRKYNLKLSERRADAVIEYMIKNGISPERLVAKGIGPDKPIKSNETEEGRSKNRRTEFYILDK